MIQLEKQKKPYTCGPACIVNIGKLFNQSFSEELLAEELEAKPLIGTSNEKILNFCIANLPVSSYGEHTYRSGLAIWNIKNAISENGHFVVVLGIKDNIVRYYDPYWSAILQFPLDKIIFSSGDEKFLNWSINFQSDQCFYDYKFGFDYEFNSEWAMNSLRSWIKNNSAS